MSLPQFLRAMGLTTGFLLATASAHAAAPQFHRATVSQQATTLQGNVSPRLAGATDLGKFPEDGSIAHMSLRFAMTPAQKADLTQLLADLQNAASPHYHQWLTPEQFGKRFGSSAANQAKASTWLTAQGLTVTRVARGGLFLEFSGTAGVVNRAFQTEIHAVLLRGENHRANVTAPALPADIAAMTDSVGGLDDFKPRPHHRETDQPRYTAAATGGHALAPGDFYTIYDENALITGGVTGTGVTIAVVGQTDVNQNDLAAFRTASGLAVNPPTVMLYGTDPGSASAADVRESELDLEWAGAVAPGASILFVVTEDAINESLVQAVDNNIAPIMSVSYGDCEADLSVSGLVFHNQLLQMAAAEGITITAPAGDTGATDCDATAPATQGLAVDFPASSPYVTGVGGTEFNEAGGTYFSATNGAHGGSALSYVPEKVWNDDSGSTLSAGGGGASLYFSKPSWQVGTGVPTDFSRDVPDVAISASPAHDAYIVCISGACVNGYLTASGTPQTLGGTSFGPPIFAGLLALVEQKTGARIGNANPHIYALANSTYASSVFHDVTTGTNASPCATGSTGCSAGGTIGYSATAGYDLATGWGSVDAYNLVMNWALVTPLVTTGGPTPSITNVAGNVASAGVGTVVTLTVQVGSGVPSNTAVPTGSAQITVDGVAAGSAVTLSSGLGTFSLSTAGLTTGSHTIQATYMGDTNFAGSKGAFSLSLTSAVPDFTISPATATVTTASGTIAPSLTFVVTALNGFTGTVTFNPPDLPASLGAEYAYSTKVVSLTTAIPSASTMLSLQAYTHAKSAPVAGLRDFGRGFYGATLAFAGLAIVLLPRRRRLNGLLLAVLTATAFGLSACAGSGSTTPTVAAVKGTPAGTYTVNVSAVGTVNGATVTHNAVVTFIVQ